MVSRDVASNDFIGMAESGAPSEASAGRQGVFRHLAIAILAGSLSLFATGHISGINNNLFNYVTLGRLYDLPQFAGDTFVQSMRYYASGFWLPFADARIDPDRFFLLWDWIARIGLCSAFLLWGRLLGVRGIASTTCFLIVLLLTRSLRGFSFAGGGDMLTNFFSHSSIATAAMLIALGLAARGRVVAASASTGIALLVNAFMGAWTCFVLVPVLWDADRRGFVDRARLGRRIVTSSFCIALASAIVLWLTSRSLHTVRHVPLDYRHYLLEYFPEHFIVWAIPPADIAAFASVVIAGWAACLGLGSRHRPAMIAISGFVVLWAIGTILPLMSTAAPVYLLHLLRAGVGAQILALLAVAARISRMAGAASPSGRFAAAMLSVAALLPEYPFALAAVAILTVPAERWPAWKWLDIVTIVLVIAIVAREQKIVRRTWRANARTEAQVVGWNALGDWARANTRLDDRFILPTAPIYASPYSLPSADPDERTASVGDEGFQYHARRRIVVDYKQGGAAMWAPAYYPEWRQKISPLLALRGVAARIRYARANGVAYVADRCEASLPAVARFAKTCLYEGAK